MYKYTSKYVYSINQSILRTESTSFDNVTRVKNTHFSVDIESDFAENISFSKPSLQKIRAWFSDVESIFFVKLIIAQLFPKYNSSSFNKNYFNENEIKQK